MSASIAELFSGVIRKKGWTRLFGGSEADKRLKAFCEEQGYETTLRSGGAYVKGASVAEARKALFGGAEILRARTRPFEVVCQVSATSQDGVAFDAEAIALASADLANGAFWRAWGENVRACGALMESAVAERVANLSFGIQDEFKRNFNYGALSTQNAAPTTWWEAQLQPIFDRLGLKLDGVRRVSYAAPSEAKARERAVREQAEKERRERVEAARREAIEEAQLAELRKQIEHDATLNDLERQAELAKRDFEALEFEREKALAQKEFELKCAENERRIAILRADAAEEEEERRRARERAEELTRTTDQIRKDLEAIGARAAEAFKELNASVKTVADEMRSGFGAVASVGVQIRETLEKLLKESEKRVGNVAASWSKEAFSRIFSDKTLDPNYRKVNASLAQGVLTRDPTDRRDDVNFLRIGDSTSMRFTAPIDGYISIVNLGTSGRYWLITPSGGSNPVRPTAARVKSGREYRVPGGELYRAELYEDGPAGWEEYVALITPRPLFSESELDPHRAIAQLSTERLLKMVEDFSQFPASACAVGYLGFNVY